MAGVVRSSPGRPVDEAALRRMARALRHRGPDGWGLVRDRGAGIVATRLAIVDIAGGWQPLAAPRSALAYNGEVYNHPELRAELRRRGASFATVSDTEVVLRLLELDGVRALERLNGQFAFAWWTPDVRRLTLVRDRFGVRPLHYALLPDGTLVFGSEAKALFASGYVEPAPDLHGLDEIFTLWGPWAPRTAFAGVRQVPPGGLVTWQDGRIVEETTWWSPELGLRGEPEGDLEELLADSVRLRLRADVPVGTYLSGGLDSSLITALARREVGPELRTFSIAFRDPRYDERAHQERVARALGTRHHAIEVGPRQIADAFESVVRHTEMPVVRTAGVPLFLLAREVREQGLKVVATGEGADELFWGYDLYKEVALRELYATDREAAIAAADRLYPHLAPAGRRGPAWWRFILEAGEPGDPLRSHASRAAATGILRSFYRPEVAAELSGADPLERLRSRLPAGFSRWSRLERAEWLELRTLLEPFLLCAQGDRVSLAHGVEGRYPFLDHRVFEHAARLPEPRKLDGLRDKVALREIGERLLPESVARRPKQPYRAPEVAPFFGEVAPEWVGELLRPESLEETGIFAADRVARLARRAREGRATGAREGMAVIGILSTELWHRSLCRRREHEPETAQPRVLVDLQTESRTEAA